MNPALPPPNPDRTRSVLSRLERETGASTMASPAGNADDAAETDWVEVWGTRIGRVLGPVLLLGGAVWLLFRHNSLG